MTSYRNDPMSECQLTASQGLGTTGRRQSSGHPVIRRESCAEYGAAPAQPASCRLWQLCCAHRGRLLLTYAVFNVENCAELAQPWLLGVAITGILSGRTHLLWGFVLFFAIRVGVGVLRRMYDTRVFMRLYGALATDMVVSQRRRDVAVSRVAARASLTREVTGFLEHDVPAAFTTGYAILGGIVMLGFYDAALVPVALLTGIAGVALNAASERRTRRLNRNLNDVLEDEVRVVSCGSVRSTSDHYAGVAYWHVRVSDWQAMTFSATQAFVLILLIVALYRVPEWNAGAIGNITAVFRYVAMFNGGIGGLPMLVLRVARLRDIGRRFAVASGP